MCQLHPSKAAAASSTPWEIGIYDFYKCLEVQGGVKDNSAQAQLWDCDGSKAHRVWHMEEVQSGWWHIWNAKSGKCLNAQGASTANGTDLIQYTCTWDWNSLFTWWPA